MCHMPYVAQKRGVHAMPVPVLLENFQPGPPVMISQQLVQPRVTLP